MVTCALPKWALLQSQNYQLVNQRGEGQELLSTSLRQQDSRDFVYPEVLLALSFLSGLNHLQLQLTTMFLLNPANQMKGFLPTGTTTLLIPSSRRILNLGAPLSEAYNSLMWSWDRTAEIPGT